MGFLKEARRTTFKLISDAEIEAQRLQGRKDVRRELAVHLANQRKAEPLIKQLAELDRRADAAADVHQEACQPAQERIREIDAEIVELLAERKDVPAKLENERAKLLDTIAAANEQLEKEVQLVKQLRKPIARERAGLDDGGKINTLTSKLHSITLGHPELFAQYFTASNMQQWTLQRITGLREELRKAKQLAEDPRMENTAVQRRHMLNAETLLARLEKMAEDLKAEQAPLLQQMIEE